ncbi:hypothetical protein NKG94_15345 [Micromonospora sp. M12]
MKWPQYYDNKLVITEYCRNWIKEVQFDNGNPRTGNPTIIEPVLAGMSFVHPIDMEFGPDGSLYLLEYGNGYFGRRRRRPLQNQLRRRRRSPPPSRRPPPTTASAR